MASFGSTAAASALSPGGAAGAWRGGRGGQCVVRASAAAAAPARTHYDVLGVGAGASRVEIKAAYRRLAREVHPDVVGGGGGGAAAGDEGFIRLHAAYATLADPDQRARYDRDMAGPAGARRAPAAFRRRRTWETDQCW